MVVVAALLVAATASPGAGQDNFKVVYNVERLEAGKTRVTGTVHNEARVDVLDVHITAEALDANNKVVARGISFVASSIPQRGTAPFTVSVPAPASATSFRVRVTSFRMGLGGVQGP
jgi:hypothetical protein